MFSSDEIIINHQKSMSGSNKLTKNVPHHSSVIHFVITRPRESYQLDAHVQSYTCSSTMSIQLIMEEGTGSTKSSSSRPEACVAAFDTSEDLFTLLDNCLFSLYSFHNLNIRFGETNFTSSIYQNVRG